MTDDSISPLQIDPAAIELPPTQPVDMTWLIADTLAKRWPARPGIRDSNFLQNVDTDG